MRVRGYGNDFPFQPDDLYLAMDLPHIQRTEIKHNLDEPLVRDVMVARSQLGKLMVKTEMETLQLEDKSLQAGLDINGVAKRYKLASILEGLDTIGANMDDIRNFTRQKGIHYLPMYADGRAMPLADNQADGVLFSNIFGDRFVRPEAKFALLGEASRVLRPDGGEITVVESRRSVRAARFMKQLSPDEWNVKCYDEDSSDWTKLKDKYHRLRFSTESNRTGAAIYFIEPATHDPYEPVT